MLLTRTLESKHSDMPAPNPSLEIVPGSTNSEPFPSNVPDRCKGSTEIEKCIEIDRQMKLETPEQRAQRQARLEAYR
jgi:hypothetical protein